MGVDRVAGTCRALGECIPPFWASASSVKWGLYHSQGGATPFLWAAVREWGRLGPASHSSSTRVGLRAGISEPGFEGQS